LYNTHHYYYTAQYYKSVVFPETIQSASWTKQQAVAYMYTSCGMQHPELHEAAITASLTVARFTTAVYTMTHEEYRRSVSLAAAVNKAAAAAAAKRS
jgi:hypothetical protein